MNTRLLLLLALLFFAALRPGLAEPAALEPGPENGGLRLRLTVVPNEAGFEVRVELVNVSKQAIILRADWRGRGGENGDLQAFVEAATSIETDPAITPWMGQVMQGTAPSPQPEQLLAAGDVLALSWKTVGRHLKNGVTDPLTVQNPEFPTPGLYAVHAVLVLPVTDGTVLLRSNEQLVPIGGSVALPKHTFATLIYVNPETKVGRINLGSLHKIAVGDAFQMRAGFGYFWKLTITQTDLWTATGSLELMPVPPGITVSQPPPIPERGLWATLIPRP